LTGHVKPCWGLARIVWRLSQGCACPDGAALTLPGGILRRALIVKPPSGYCPRPFRLAVLLLIVAAFGGQRRRNPHSSGETLTGSPNTYTSTTTIPNTPAGQAQCRSPCTDSEDEDDCSHAVPRCWLLIRPTTPT
jgi:hypothetical protein